MIDIHSHIIPWLDDGPKDEEMMLKMLHIAETEGIKEIVATPHVIPGLYRNGAENISQMLLFVRDVIKREEIDLKIHYGAEHYLDDGFQKLLKEGKVCTINNQGKYLLVEFPMREIPSYAETLMFQIQLAGITPILAHPERNAGILRKPEFLYELVSRGVLLQVNSTSLTGHFGKAVTELAVNLIRNRWVHFIASDAHSAGIRGPRLRQGLKIARDILGYDEANKLVYDNPGLVLAGEPIETEEVQRYVPARKSILQMVKKLF